MADQKTPAPTATPIDAVALAARMASVRERIARAAEQAGRPADAVMLVLASKSQPPEAIRAAYRAGAREFGENYVQEALAKRPALGDLANLRWHLIGHLQTNKAQPAAESFDLIQTLDSERLARALAKARLAPPVKVLIEINLGGEASKTGVAPERAEALINAARGLVAVTGLMAIPPPAENNPAAHASFAALRRLRDQLAAHTGLELRELSMGMTDDFEAAIAEGATIVRIGRAIFGERIR